VKKKNSWFYVDATLYSLEIAFDVKPR
jgi:hypothetical protein